MKIGWLYYFGVNQVNKEFAHMGRYNVHNWKRPNGMNPALVYKQKLKQHKQKGNEK